MNAGDQLGTYKIIGSLGAGVVGRGTIRRPGPVLLAAFLLVVSWVASTYPHAAPLGPPASPIIPDHNRDRADRSRDRHWPNPCLYKFRIAARPQ